MTNTQRAKSALNAFKKPDESRADLTIAHHCFQEERMLVELKRKDRLMFAQKPVYNHPEVMIPPFIPMEKFLSDYQKGFSLPEHDIQKAIIIS